MEPVIKFGNESVNPSESTVVPSTSGYVQPAKKNTGGEQIQAAQTAHGPDDTSQPGSSQPVSSQKGKASGKKMSAKSSSGGTKRKFVNASEEFSAPISRYDPVSYPAYPFQSAPSSLKIDDLQKVNHKPDRSSKETGNIL